jgi:hypothetical protein
MATIVSQLSFNRYSRLIEYAKNNPPNGPAEKHHIVPRSMGGDNSTKNIVRLSLRMHFIAHWLLWKSYRNDQMANAFWTMACCHGFRITSKTYHAARLQAVKKISQASKGKKLAASHIETLRKRLTGRTVSEETKQKLRISSSGRKHSDAAKAKMTQSRTGKKLSEETKAKMSAAKKGKPSNTLGKTYKRKTPVTLEQRLQMSQQRAGRKMSLESSEKKRKAMTGRKLQPDVLNKLKILWSSPEFKARHSEIMKNYFSVKRETGSEMKA